MDTLQKKKSIKQLNEDCEILIKKEIEKYLVNYGSGNELVVKDPETAESGTGGSPEMKQLYFSPYNRAIEMKERCPKMLPSSSANMDSSGPRQPLTCRRSLLKNPPKVKRCVDEPVQATEEKYSAVPRSTILARARQQLSKRNSGSQSLEVKYRTIKTQTESCARNSVAVGAEPMDFIGMFEKATNVPIHGKPGVTKDQCTQMYEHVTQSELFCIEWIHKNLFEVKLNPNTLVVDDRLRDHSESACVT